MKPHRAGRKHRSKQTSPQAKPKPDVFSLNLFSEQEGTSIAFVEFTEKEFDAIAAQAARVGGYQKLLSKIASGTVTAAADASASQVKIGKDGIQRNGAPPNPQTQVEINPPGKRFVTFAIYDADIYYECDDSEDCGLLNQFGMDETLFKKVQKAVKKSGRPLSQFLADAVREKVSKTITRTKLEVAA